MKIKKLLALILSLAIILTSCINIVTTVLADENTIRECTMSFGTAAIKGAGKDFVYFGKYNGSAVKWRVLDSKKTNMGNAGMFLLSEKLYGTGDSGSVYFKNVAADGSTDTALIDANKWQDSDAKAWTNNFANNIFSTFEAEKIISTTKSDAVYTTSGTSNKFKASENILNGDKLFFLSAEEADNAEYGFVDDDSRIANYGIDVGAYWLRSAYAHFDNLAGFVNIDGTVVTQYVNNNKFAAARPALNLDSSSVCFVSAANSVKPNGIESVLGIAPTEWRFTFKDSHSFADGTAVISVSDNDLKAGSSITLVHKALNQIDSQYTKVTCAIADTSGNMVYYGAINADTSATRSIIDLPEDITKGEYTIYIYGECQDSEDGYDYATGTPFVLPISVGDAAPETVEPTTVSFTLDVGTNGGQIGGDSIKVLKTEFGATYCPTDNYTVTAPTGQKFLGWSTDKDAYYGEFTFTPTDNTTYYAIFGEVIYVGDTVTDSSADLGTIENPYTALSAAAIGANPFTNTAVNCVVVLNGSVTLKSISSWAARRDARLYITGLDPTTGVQNETALTVTTFATSSASTAVFGKGLFVDNCKIVSTNSDSFYIRQNASHFVLGKNVVCDVAPTIIGTEATIPSIYIESSASQITKIESVRSSSYTVTGDLTVVIGGGKITDSNNGIMLSGKVGGNASVVINGYENASLRVNTKNLTNVNGAINYIFNNGTKEKIEKVKLWINCIDWDSVDDAVPTAKGFYYINSAAGGKVIPTETTGKFKVEFDEGYGYIMVNGEITPLDSDNCFTLDTAATNITPTESDWINITYGKAASFKFDLNGQNGTVPDTVSGIPGTVAANLPIAVANSNKIEFLGWSLYKNATAPDTSFIFDSFGREITLYAVWRDHATATIVLDAGTNGGQIDGSSVAAVQTAAGAEYTPGDNYTVTAPTGQKFLGWSTDKDAYYGEFTFTPTDNTTYYAIFGEVIYVGDTVTDSSADLGTIENPYTALSAAAIGANPFTNTAVNCVVVLNGTVTLSSISNWHNTRCSNGHLYITGLDPTTGVQNETAVTLSTFATGMSTQQAGVFGKGLLIDNCNIVSASGTNSVYLRGVATNFVIGKNVTCTANVSITGADYTIPSIYIESAANQLYQINTAYSSVNVTGDVTVVLNGGKIGDPNKGIMLGGNIGGNASVVINGYENASLRVNTENLTNVNGAINYIFNNGTKEKIENVKLWINCIDWNSVDDAVPTKKGFYYINSAAGGKVIPTETTGKFKVEFDEGYNYITVNGQKTPLDSYNCFTVANASTVLQPTASDWLNIAYGYDAPASDNNTFTVPVNHILDLSKIGIKFDGETNPVNGSSVVWDTCATAIAEISGGKLIAFRMGKQTVNVSYGGKTATVTFDIKIVTSDTLEGLTRFADTNMTVNHVGNKTYTVAIAETDDIALRYGTLKVNDNTKTTLITDASDISGEVFVFSVNNPENMVISAEYTTKATRKTSIYPLGAQIRPETDEYTAGIRFLTRFPQITGDGETAVLDETYRQVGVLLIPEVLWDGETYPTAEELAEAEPSMGTYSAQNVSIRKLMTATEAYSDAVAALVNIPFEMRNVKIVAIPYLISTNNVITYVTKEDMLSRSYSAVYAKEYPADKNVVYDQTNIKDIFTAIGTNNELDNSPETSAISYAVGEEITFTVLTAGNYSFDYYLYKDNNSALAEYGEALVSGTENCVKSGRYNPDETHIFKLTTRLDNPGTVRLSLKVFDSEGNLLTFTQEGKTEFSITAAAGAEQVNLPSNMLVTESAAAEFYGAFKTDYAAQTARIRAGLESESITNWFLGTKPANDTVTYNDGVSDVFTITYLGVQGSYDKYSVIVATVDAIDGFDGSPLTSATNGKFPYNDYLSRPSTFVMSIPTGAAADSCAIKAGFYGYGTVSAGFEYNANTITTKTAPHGLLNLQASSYYTTAQSVNYKNGGTGSAIMQHSEATTKELYAYGVLVRDYISLQFAKYMPQFNTASTVTTYGGSQGGWQAVSIAATDTDVDICNSDITWLTTANISDDGYSNGWMPPYSDAYKMIMSTNALKAIGNRQGFKLNIVAALSDETCPLYGLLALYNTAQCETTFKGYQFSGHHMCRFDTAYGSEFVAYMSKSYDVDLVLFAGQSNMSGRGTAADAEVCPEGQGYWYKNASMWSPSNAAEGLYSIAEPFGNEAPNSTGSMVSAFAKEYYAETGVPIVAVSASYGGSSISKWDTTYVNYATSYLSAAKSYLEATGKNVRRVFVVWNQGETDAQNGMSTADYKTYFNSVWSKIKNAGAEECFIINIGQRKNGDFEYTDIKNALSDLCKADDIVMVSDRFTGATEHMKDNFHYNQLVYNVVGKDAAENVAYYYSSGKEPTLTTFPLAYGKSVIFFGDSITAASNATGDTLSGWAGRVGTANAMTWKNAGVSGASISTVRASRIITQLNNNKSKQYDLVIMQGGVNDAMSSATVGTVSSSYNVTDFDTSTFAGALEELFYTAKQLYPNAKLGYIVNYATPNSTWGGATKDMSAYFTVAKQICDKWDISYLDLYSGTVVKDGKTLSYSYDILKVNTAEYFNNNSAWDVHIGVKGYDVISPYILNWINTLN